MPIVVCGLNHKTAPISVREQAVFTQEKLPLYLNDLVANEKIREAVLLSTCNRSELYCEVEYVQDAVQWFSRQHNLPKATLENVLYCYEGEDAVQHIMNVACGLDSMVLGETQILGQMKEAFSESCAQGAVGPFFNRLFQYVFSIAKEVRTNTMIGACPVSVSSSAVNFAKQFFNQNLEDVSILLVGAGATIQLVLRYLKNHRPKNIFVANRTLENTHWLAQEHAIESVSFLELPKILAHADIVISATGSPVPIIRKEMITERDKPLYIMDIAVPRDVDLKVSDHEHVKLYSIDDLKTMIQQNMRGREHAAEKAKDMIKTKSEAFMVWQRSLDKVADTIRSYRNQIEGLTQAELKKAIKQLERGETPVEVLNAFAYALTNKILHAPSVQLRQAGVDGRLDILQWAQQLFAIPEIEPKAL